MQVPQIKEPTQIEKQYAIEAVKAADFGESWLVTANRALKIQNIAYQTICQPQEANAEQSQEQYITAEEACKLGAGNAEWGYNDTSNRWFLCTDKCKYPSYLLYRAIKPKPQQAAMPQPYNKELYCQVKNLDTDELKTMTREAAKLLQAETKDTHTWFDPEGYDWVNPFDFHNSGIYTYKLKANLVKLDGALMSREAAIAIWESKKDTCDVWFKNLFNHFVCISNCASPLLFEHSAQGEYLLRERPLKQIEWTGSREDVIALLTELGFIHEDDLCTIPSHLL